MQPSSWYLLDQSSGTPKALGPFTQEEMARMVAAGQVLASSLVAPVGASGWTEAASDLTLGVLFRVHPPVSPVGGSPASALAEPGPYSFGGAFALGWACFKSRWSAWVLLALAFIGAYIVITFPNIVLNTLGESAERAGNASAGARLKGLGAMIGVLLSVVVGLPLYCGMIFAASRIHAGEASLGNLFEGFRKYPVALGCGLLQLLILAGLYVGSFVPLFAATALAAPAPRDGFSFMLVFCGLASIVIFVALMAWVYMRVLFAPVIAIDPAFGNPGAFGAFRISWARSAGMGPSMLGLLIVTGLLAAASILLLCVGYVFVGVPLMFSIVGAMYIMLHRGPAGGPPPALNSLA